MKVLIDENFPLGLLRRLHADGFAAEHIITLGRRGAPDTRIRERLQDEEVLFPTQDDDFLFGPAVSAIIVVSRVKQSRRSSDRIEVWRSAVRELANRSRPERLFELMTTERWRPGATADYVPRSRVSHLAHIFLKTGTTRQAALVRLLLTVPSAPCPTPSDDGQSG